MLSAAHQVVLLQLPQQGVPSAPKTLARLAFCSGDTVCCAAWDASGKWLAVGTAQQLHLYRATKDSATAGHIEAVASTALCFATKVGLQ